MREREREKRVGKQTVDCAVHRGGEEGAVVLDSPHVRDIRKVKMIYSPSPNKAVQTLINTIKIVSAHISAEAAAARFRSEVRV